MVKKIAFALLACCLFAFGLFIFSAQREVQRNRENHDMLVSIAARCSDFEMTKKHLPAGFAELEEQGAIGVGKLRNQITGDDPGFEINKLDSSQLKDNPSAVTVIAYQLREGSYDPKLPVAYIDCHTGPAPAGFLPGQRDRHSLGDQLANYLGGSTPANSASDQVSTTDQEAEEPEISPAQEVPDHPTVTLTEIPWDKNLEGTWLTIDEDLQSFEFTPEAFREHRKNEKMEFKGTAKLMTLPGGFRLLELTSPTSGVQAGYVIESITVDLMVLKTVQHRTFDKKLLFLHAGTVLARDTSGNGEMSDDAKRIVPGLIRKHSHGSDGRLPLDEHAFARESGIADPGDVQEARAIAGLWHPMSYRSEGQEEKLQFEWRFVFKDNVLYMVQCSLPYSANAFEVELDPTAEPKRIDLSIKKGDKKTTLQGIYQIGGRYMGLCWSKKSRPENFDPTDSNTVMSLRRLE